MEEDSGSSTTKRSPKKEIKGEKQLMLVISERFLEEKSTLGDKVSEPLHSMPQLLWLRFVALFLCFDVAAFMLYPSSWTDGT